LRWPRTITHVDARTPRLGDHGKVEEDRVYLGVCSPDFGAYPSKIELGLKPSGDASWHFNAGAAKTDDVPPGRFEVSHEGPPARAGLGGDGWPG